MDKCENLFFVDVQKTVMFSFAAPFENGHFRKILHSVEDRHMSVRFGFTERGGWKDIDLGRNVLFHCFSSIYSN
jgi:hypothetical protein